MLDIYELPLCNLLISHHIEAIFMKGMHLIRVLTSITTVDLFFLKFKYIYLYLPIIVCILEHIYH